MNLTLKWFWKAKDHNDVWVIVEGAQGYNNNRAYACAVIVDHGPEDEGIRFQMNDGRWVERCVMDVEDIMATLEPTTPEAVDAHLVSVVHHAILDYIDPDHSF